MARIKQRFETKKTISETRTFIDQRILSRPEIELLLQEHHWEGNVLHARGALGEGTVTIEHEAVLVDIELSLFGAAAQSRIEQALTDQFKQLKD